MFQVFPYTGYGTIDDTLKLNFVDDARADPNGVSVFNHPDNREAVQVREDEMFRKYIVYGISL